MRLIDIGVFCKTKEVLIFLSFIPEFLKLYPQVTAMKQKVQLETAETLAAKQREISVSEFFLKNRHLLGFDNPRRALLTAVKEAVDNSLDACDEAGILPTISVEIEQTREDRFRVSVTDNGPGIVKNEIPKIFAKLLYGSKFHRLRMARGQQGIGISAAGMYAQLTTGSATRILSRTAKEKIAHLMEVQIDTSKNQPKILKYEAVDWQPEFPVPPETAEKKKKTGKEKVDKSSNRQRFPHGTCVSLEIEAAYVRGKLSVDEYLKQCAIVNPHLELWYRIKLLPKTQPLSDEESNNREKTVQSTTEQKNDIETQPPQSEEAKWIFFARAQKHPPKIPHEIKPHPHGVEIGLLTQMLRDTKSRALRAMLTSDFSRVSANTALEICKKAELDPKANPTRLTPDEIERLFKAINETKLMRPPTDCLSPIGEEAIIAGLQKELEADFCTAVTRPPAVYRGNPFQVEAGLAYIRHGEENSPAIEEPVRVMRFANRVPLLYMAGACAITKAIINVNWKNYRLQQPRDSLPLGPVVIMVHLASVWVPFTSESKEAIAHYPEIIREIMFCLQECGRRLAVFLNKRRREAEVARKRSYIAMYIPHLALGLKEVLNLSDREESRLKNSLEKLLGNPAGKTE